MKKIFLGAALLVHANVAFAQMTTIDMTATDQTQREVAALAKVSTSCPGKTLAAMPEFSIPAGILIGRLEPGGSDPDGNPTSYTTRDKDGHALFLPADKVQLLFCIVQKHKPASADDVGYSLTFNPPLDAGKNK